MTRPYHLQRYPNGAKITIPPQRQPLRILGASLFFLLLFLAFYLPLLIPTPWDEVATNQWAIPYPMPWFALALHILTALACLWTVGWQLAGTEVLLLTEEGAVKKREMGPFRSRTKVQFPRQPKNKRFHAPQLTASAFEWPMGQRSLHTPFSRGRVKLTYPKGKLRVGVALLHADAHALVAEINGLGL